MCGRRHLTTDGEGEVWNPTEVDKIPLKKVAKVSPNGYKETEGFKGLSSGSGTHHPGSFTYFSLGVRSRLHRYGIKGTRQQLGDYQVRERAFALVSWSTLENSWRLKESTFQIVSLKTET